MPGGRHAVIAAQPAAKRLGICQGQRPLYQADRRDRNRPGLDGLEVFGKEAVDFRSDGARGEFRMIGDRRHRDDGVGFHQHNRTRDARGDRCAPVALHTQIAGIAHQQRRVFRQSGNDLLRRSRSDAESDAAFRQALFRFPQALQHELIMPPIRLRKARQSKGSHNRQAQGIGLFNGVFQRVIELRTLSLLHPIEHILAPAHLTVGHAVDAGFMDHGSSLLF